MVTRVPGAADQFFFDVMTIDMAQGAAFGRQPSPGGGIESASSLPSLLLAASLTDNFGLQAVAMMENLGK